MKLVIRHYPIAVLMAPLLILSSCVTKEEREQPAAPLPPPYIDKLFPAETTRGRGFGIQPSGESAIAVTGRGFQRGGTIRFNGNPLPTTYGSNIEMTALVPSSSYGEAGTIQVSVTNPDGKASNSMPFSVRGDGEVAPEITHLSPASAVAGKPMNPQPDGSSALSVQGSNFDSGAVVYFNGVPLATTYGGPTIVTAIVPAPLLAKPKAARITVANPDKRKSAPALLTIK